MAKSAAIKISRCSTSDSRNIRNPRFQLGGGRTGEFDTIFKFVLRRCSVNMNHLSRFGVSHEEDLLAAFDLSIA